MKPISSEQAKYIREKHPEVMIFMCNKGKKSRNKRYKVEETNYVDSILSEFENKGKLKGEK